MTTTDTRPDQAPPLAHNTRVGPGTDLPADQMIHESHVSLVGGEQGSGISHVEGDTQPITAGAGQIPPPTLTRPSPNDGPSAGAETPPPAIVAVAPKVLPPVVDPLLFIHATIHADLEQQRIATDNRLRILTTDTPDDDGVMRGFGLSEAHPDVARVAGIAQALAKLEHDAELGLGRALRRSAIYPWVKAQRGLGDKQTARLLSAIGDPYWHTGTMNEDGTVRHMEGPRTVSELWSYAGYRVVPASHSPSETLSGTAGGASDHPIDHITADIQRPAVGGVQTSNPGQMKCETHGGAAGVAVKRRKGQRCNWSTDAKTRAYLIAVSCLKQLDADCKDGHTPECTCSLYRVKYDTRRAHTAATHPDWNDGHSHNDALRVAAKEILKDLWREAKRLHDPPADLRSADTQHDRVGGATDTRSDRSTAVTHRPCVGPGVTERGAA